ncbi:MAG: cytidine deaminase [Prevotella sp.]|nr:cytidine deaminase [Prevotella sp.]
MKELNIEIKLRQCQIDELAPADRELVEKAIEATANSYAPYSHFNVGAAIRLDDGRVMIGANQENAAFPCGLCAERTAIFAAQAQCPDQPITAIAIAAKNQSGLLSTPISPCGQCRQVMLEIEDRYKRPLRILLYGTSGIIVVDSTKDLMPLSFVDANMH